MDAITLETMQAVIRENRDTIDDQKRLRAIGKCHIGDNPDEQKTLSYFFRVVLDYLGIHPITNIGDYIESWGEQTLLPDGKAYIQKLCIDWRPQILIDCQKYNQPLNISQPLRVILKQQLESNPDVRICILTNGLDYDVYDDIGIENEVDCAPIYSFNILNLSDSDLQVLNSLRARRSSEVLRAIQQLQK